MDNTTLIIKYTDKELTGQEARLFKKELGKNPELMYEYDLHLSLNSFMKGKFMSEHVAQDILLEDADKFAKEAIKEHVIDGADSDILDFLNKEKSAGIDFDKTINQIEKESSEKKIDQLSEQWVEEWNDLKKDTEYFNELKAFVTNGMLATNMAVNQKANLKVIKSKEPVNNLRFINKWSYAVASIAAILIISIGLWTYFSAPIKNAELFASNYQPYKIVSKQLRSATDKEPGFNEAVDLYKSQNYGKASLLLKNKINMGDESAKTIFLYALTLIENEDYNQAILEFKDIIAQFDNYQIESKWYLSLCYLKTDKTDKAVSLLTELSSTKNYYRERALKLLDKIK